MSTRHYCLQRKPVPLAHGETLVLEDAAGVVIDACSGLLWITVAGEAGDVFLAPGQSWCVMGRGRVVIEGASKSLNALRLHCPTAFLAARARPFLDRDLLCRLSSALRGGRTTA
ncbi:MAG: hypothetical protein EFKGCFLK_00030 [Rhodocyclaceae bacterium]|nr:MAG: DUF2917 domain-containing protein [Rhodocyclaceae bacterium]MBV6406485.1 hypothetical protein [Rhodocyclaceae bacterium]CAG0928676.1 hypothetical protein RHDC3_00833 [Rhodocyclaceae bacterium]